MKIDKIKASPFIETAGFLSNVKFCPFDTASNLLAHSTPDGLHICSVMFDDAVKTTPNQKVLSSHEKLISFTQIDIRTIAWSPESTMKYLPKCAKIAAGLQNGKIIIFTTDFKEEKSDMILEGHTGCVNDLQFDPVDGLKLASTSDDHSCRIWDVENAEMIYVINLLYSGVSVCWNILDPGKLMVSEQSGRIRFYDLNIESTSTIQPFLCLECNRGTLTAADWCSLNALKVGATVGNEYVLWDTSKYGLAAETKQAHSDGCTTFKWSTFHEDIFLTQGRPKFTLKVHHLGYRKLLLQEINNVGSGVSWHQSLPICACASNNAITFHVLDDSV